MIRHPYGPDELDRNDPVLDAVAEQLEAFASDQRSAPPLDLAARIHAAVDAAPDPAVGWWVRFTGPMAPWWLPARGIAAAAVVATAVAVALVAGNLAELTRGPIAPASSPSPSVIVTPTPSPSPSQTPSPSASPSPSARQRSATPVPSASDDELETPEPSESDNSGPGGGGDDNSGPGGGGDDNSGPGG